MALRGLIDRIRPKFLSNLHSPGQRILYPQGWQIGTLDADNPVYVALAGTDANPAIPGFNPGQSADAVAVNMPCTPMIAIDITATTHPTYAGCENSGMIITEPAIMIP